MVAGVISPVVRTGTFVGALCSTVALGVLLGAMIGDEYSAELKSDVGD